jgi:hypothetical protein
VKGSANYRYAMIVVVIFLLTAHRLMSLTRTPPWRSGAAVFTDEKREFLRDDRRFQSDVLALRQKLLRRADGGDLLHRCNLVQLDWNQIIADRVKRATGGPDSTVDLASR